MDFDPSDLPTGIATFAVGVKDDTVVIVDPDGREFFLVNPDDWSIAYRPVDPLEGFYGLWFGQSHPTRVGVWAYSIEEALEEAAGWLYDHRPGHFVDDDYLKEREADARKELGSDAEDDNVFQAATEDLIYTESGYLPSEDVGMWYDGSKGQGRLSVGGPASKEDLAEAVIGIGKILNPDRR